MSSTAILQHKNTISILGCGWYGQALAKALISDGIQVKGSTTSPGKLALLASEGILPYLVNFSADDETYDPDFFNCGVLFIAIPPQTRSGAGDQFIHKIQCIISAIKLHGVKKAVLISSTSVYADLNCEVDENTQPLPDKESGKILLEAEHLFKNEPAFKTTIIRFAGLIGPDRNPGRFFAGKKDVPNGNAPVNLIHLDDCIGISKAILKEDALWSTVLMDAHRNTPQSRYFIQKLPQIPGCKSQNL